MKLIICFALAATALVNSTVTYAQSASTHLTRAEVYADLVRVEQAGYRPSANDPNYPEDIQAAEAKIAAQSAAHVDVVQDRH